MLFSDLSADLSQDMAAALLELIGTAFFLIIGLGGIQAATAENLSSERPASNIQQVLYISTSMGFSLLISAWLFFRITGGLFNPNVSLALLLVGAIKPVRFVLYCIAQLLGAIAGSAILRWLTSKSLSVKFVIGFSDLPILFAHLTFSTFLQEGTSATQGVFIEMFITSALVFSVLMLAAEKHQATAFAPVLLSSLYFSPFLKVFLSPRLASVSPFSHVTCTSGLLYTCVIWLSTHKFLPQFCGILYRRFHEYRKIVWTCCNHRILNS
jgi:aquaporin rerated protein, other eukaryote